jgi:N-acetylglutamate synthase-like GNAT family acetyltransferase
MRKTDEYYVGTCTHVDEKSKEMETCAKKRIEYFNQMKKFGLNIKVALIDSQHAGFIYLFPIEHSPWEVQGRNLYLIPCLVSHSKFAGNKIGKALIKEAEKEAKKQKKDGICVYAIDWDNWFMPASYFIHLGFQIADHKDNELLLWKSFNKNAIKPEFIKESYRFKKIKKKVVIDLFYNNFCQTSAIELQRVRSVIKEFGDKVVYNEFNSDNRNTCEKFGISRAIYINGKPLDLKGEIPKEELRKQISNALKVNE